MATETVKVRAYAFAATFRLKEIAAIFVEAGAEPKLTQDELTATFPDGARAVAFDFGALVFFGCDAARRERVVKAVEKRYPGEPHAPLTEEFLVDVVPGAVPEAKFERVVVGELGNQAVAVVGLLLAQSAAMDYYEEDVAEILAKTSAITRELAREGRLRGRVSDSLRFVGSCMQTKDAIIETLALFDKPDATWEQESLDKLYIGLRAQLEIDDRFRALEYKLRMIQENSVLLIDLARGRHSILLETLVLVLIVVEVLVMLWQIWGQGVAGRH